MPYSVRVLLAGSVLLAAGTAPVFAQSAPGVPAYRTFQEWVIGCDNTRSCVAIGFPVDGGQGDGFVHIERAAGGNAEPTITLAVYDETPAGRSQMTVEVDGAAAPGVAPQAAVTDQEQGYGYTIATLHGADARALIAALRNGKQLTLATSAEDRVQVSLDGSAATLLFMDDVQGRVDTPSALARPGNRPASAVPAAVAPPRVVPFAVPSNVQADPALANVLRERAGDACESVEPDSGYDEVYPLGNDKALVSIMCSRGAYNFDNAFFIVEKGDPRTARPAAFPNPEEREDPAASPIDTLTNGEFDPASGLLSYFYKGRGVGDCGNSGTYAWTGREFVLVEYRVMSDCRGVPESFWPQLWRASTPAD